MARTKVQIERGTGLKQTVVIDTSATKGATLGTNVYMPNGTIGTPASVTQWLGLQPGGSANIRSGYGILITSGNSKTVNVNRAAAFDWQGQHTWTQPLQGPNGTNALPAFTFSSDPNTGVYRVGADNLGVATNGVLRWDVDTTRTLQTLPQRIATSVAISGTHYEVLKYYRTETGNNGGYTLDFQDGTPIGDDLEVRIGMWARGDITTAVPPTGAIGFAFDTVGHGTNAAEFLLRRYNASSTPATLMQAASDAAQMQFPQGVGATPGVSFIGVTDAGFYYDPNGSRLWVAASVGGVGRWAVSATRMFFTGQSQGPDGNAGTPTYSFGNDANTGMFSGGADVISFSTNGANRLSIETAQIAYNLALRGPNGSNTAPAFSFSGDNNTGMYSVGADQIGFATNGVLRLTVDAALSLTSTLPIFAPAATTAGTSIRLPHGAAPSAPVDGDMWTTTAGLYVRINGATVGPLA